MLGADFLSTCIGVSVDLQKSLGDFRAVVEAMKVVFPKPQSLFSLVAPEVFIETLVQTSPHFFVIAGSHHPAGFGFVNPLADRTGFAAHKKKRATRGKNTLDL